MKRLPALLVCLALLICPALAEAPESGVREAVLGAMEVYSWFTISPLDVCTESPASESGRYPVFDNVLARVDVMQDCLSRCFSDEIIQSLWDWGAYEEINGWLYGFPAGENPFARAIDPNIADVSFAQIEETDAKRVYAATVYYLYTDQPETLEFVQEYLNGQWVFTEFPFFW